MSERLFIRKGMLVDPMAGSQGVGDLFIENGQIAAVPPQLPLDAKVLDASNLIVAPAFWDLHVHLREPGLEEAETIESGCCAAARGGFSKIVAMPNTKPPVDTPDGVRYIIERASRSGGACVLPTGCITVGRAGRELTDFASLQKAGVVALTDDGTTPADERVMETAMQKAAELGLLIMDHAQDPALEQTGVMHDGKYSKMWQWSGIPVEAERRMVERDIRLAQKTACRVHIQHVSSAAACELLRRARAEGVPVSAEVTPHHLALCDEHVDPSDANFKMNPPLRSAYDRAALLDAVCEGVITTLATDHAPHTFDSKSRGFLDAPFGVVGLETAVGVTWRVLVESGRLQLIDWIRLWTTGPAEILKRPLPSLRVGAPADIVLLDLQHEWMVDPKTFASRSRNTPFSGWRLRARAVATIYEGRVVWRAR